MNAIDGTTSTTLPARRAPSRGLRPWLIGLALASPAFLPYLTHLVAHPAGRRPSGFIWYDQPYYLANAREHFDGGRFRLFYSNPSDPSYEAPAIYVQPMSLALGAIMHATGVDPGLLILGFEVLAAWACARVALALYEEVAGLGGWARRLGLVAFFWGGGLLAIAGIGRSLRAREVPWDVFHFDPADGWWFLNFGRNLVFPTEALYHALFFGCILCLLRRRFLAAASLAFLVSASHPFTGVELLLILASWSALERLFVRSTAVPGAFLLAIVGLLGLHLGYYLAYLTRFPEHRELMESWTLAWELQARHFVPAYALVGALAWWSFRRLDLACRFFSEPANRLFLTWFLVAFALANHEFAIRPIQPLHFTRGYIWTPLFLMGAGPLVEGFARLLRPGRRILGTVAVGLILAMLLLDNILWLGRFPFHALQRRPAPTGFTVSAAQLDLYRWLGRDENRGALLLTSEPELGYLSSAYTPLRSWTGHQYNTPDLDQRRREIDGFLQKGDVVDAWWGKTLLLVIARTAFGPLGSSPNRARPTYQNADYLVFRLEPKRSGPPHGLGISPVPEPIDGQRPPARIIADLPRED